MFPPSRRLILVAGVMVVLAGIRTTPSLVQPPAQRRVQEMDRLAQMQQHFGQVMTMHEALIRGDLQTVRESATWLAGRDRPAGLPDGSEPYIEAMRQAAARAASAPDALAAASATAAMLATCGDCHRAVGAEPVLAVARRAGRDGLAGHMEDHRVASELMLQGLVVPSASRWEKGAAGFAAAPLHPESLPKGEDRERLAQTEAHVHRAASRALQATDSVARGMVYGEILAGCADCHQHHPARATPGRF